VILLQNSWRPSRCNFTFCNKILEKDFEMGNQSKILFL
jgi:hypothetical protein